MAIELQFAKPDNAASWGFRLVGGADFNEPLVVVKVNENSYAENAGLMVGDVIVRINNTATSGITHADAHELIHNAGCNFLIAIRRGLFCDIPIPMEEENNNELENILENSIAERFADIQKEQEIGSGPKNLENLAGQEQLVSSIKSADNNEKANRPKKFSSFLVKPKNPIPVPKKEAEERKIIGEPYRVKIVKQPKRDPKEVLNRRKSVQFEPKVTEVEISCDSSIADSTESNEIYDIRGDLEMEIETSVEVAEETTVEITQEEDSDQDKSFDNMDNDSLDNQLMENENECTIRKLKPIFKPTPIDIHIDPVICESSLSLEDQLAAVQKQLLALSQLPSAIQVTLEAVTNQLNKIVMDKMQKAEESVSPEKNDFENDNENENDHLDRLEETEEEIMYENASLSENAEGDITENETEDIHLEELEKDCDFEDKDDNITVDSDERTLVEIENAKNDPYAGLTDEEKEARIMEEQLMAKKQKIEEHRRNMDWTQRPIVLPGGRKWSDPDDATPKLKNPKMSDEKICRTLDDYSEVLVGKTKGINFLKYQPPPKNLDYLKNSEVYRLIHGMEAPPRGVGARAEKILSEKDYYGDKGAP